jgi:hypothetical protein
MHLSAKRKKKWRRCSPFKFVVVIICRANFAAILGRVCDELAAQRRKATAGMTIFKYFKLKL